MSLDRADLPVADAGRVMRRRHDGSRVPRRNRSDQGPARRAQHPRDRRTLLERAGDGYGASETEYARIMEPG
ncbi:hypothetical protein EMGR_000519 [Emarellia grisea]